MKSKLRELRVLRRIIKRQLQVVAFLLGVGLGAQAQVTSSGSSAPPVQARPVSIVQSAGSPVPQVVTVVHRLNGMKVLSLLHRGGQSPKVVGDEFLTSSGMLTSVTAGFALGDGKSVVARLPQAEAEAEFSFFWPGMPGTPTPFAPQAAPSAQSSAAPASSLFPSLPELLVIQRDGTPRAARYIGLDAGTGLSLLQIEGLGASPPRDCAEEQISLGRRVRLLAPQRTTLTASQTPPAAPGKLYLSVGEIEGEIKELQRSSNGRLSHLIVHAPKLSAAFAGGVALNEAGETIGIIEASNAGEARVMPMALVRRAAARVLARRGNVPQPWLGIRGQAVAATSLSQFLARGWSEKEAMPVLAKQYGILLTTVAPGTPAAKANLRSGDVIFKLNEDVVKSVEDFSFMLNEAGSGATVNLTVLRGDQLKTPTVAVTPPAVQLPKTFEFVKPVIVSVKLSESLNPVRSIREAETKWRPSVAADSLAAVGVEGIPLTPKAAARLGASGGVLVVFVGRESPASQAGLRVFDIIESIDGQVLSPSNAASFNSTDARPQTFVVVRNRQKFSFSFSFSMEEKKKQ